MSDNLLIKTIQEIFQKQIPAFQKGIASTCGIGKDIYVTLNGKTIKALSYNIESPGEVNVFYDNTNKRYVAWTEKVNNVLKTNTLRLRKTRIVEQVVSKLLYPFKVLYLVNWANIYKGGDNNDIDTGKVGQILGFNNYGDYYAIVKNNDDYTFLVNDQETNITLISNQFVNEQMPFFNWVGGSVLISNGSYASYTGTADNTPLGQNWFAVAKFDHDGGIFRSIFSGVYNSEDVTGSEVNNYGGNLGTGSTTYDDVPVTGGIANHSRNITAAPTHIYSYDLIQRFQLPVLVDGQLISVETQMLASNSNNFSESRTESGELVETFTSGGSSPVLTDLTYTGTASMTSSESGSSSFELSFDYPFIVDSVKKVRRISNVGTRSGSGSGSVVESLDWGFAGSTVSIGYDIHNTTIANHIVNGTGTSIDFAPTIILIGGINQEIVLYYYLAIESNYTTSSGIDVNRDTTISRPRYLASNNDNTRFSFFWGTALSPQWNVLMGDYGTISEYTQEYVYPPIESLNVQINDITYEITDTYADYGDHFYMSGYSNTSFENEGSYTFNVSNVQIGVSDRNKGLYGIRERGSNLTYSEGYYDLSGKTVNVFWIIEGQTQKYTGTITSLTYTESTTGNETYRTYTTVTVNIANPTSISFYCWSNILTNGVVITPVEDHTVSLLKYLTYQRYNVNTYLNGDMVQIAISKNLGENVNQKNWFADLYEFDTSNKQFIRVGNKSGALSKLDDNFTYSNFISYHP